MKKRSIALRIVVGTVAALVLIVLLLLGAVYVAAYHPDDVQPEEVTCPTDAPELRPGQVVRILNWNIQYMASKNYVFWYDIADGSGPDTRPTEEHVYWTLDEVAAVIERERPDIVLLQEMGKNSVTSHYVNQMQELLQRIPDEYSCYAESYYWKSAFVPQPEVWGRADMLLGTISRYRITQATRYQLPLIPSMWIAQELGLKRAILQVEMPIAGGPSPLMALNTHLDAFAQGPNTMELQVKAVADRLTALNEEERPWFIGGDFNLLPPDVEIPEEARSYYNDVSEIGYLFDRFQSTATREQLTGPNRSLYFTHFSNNPVVTGPDRTIDYIFYSERLRFVDYRVWNTGHALEISDHMPLFASFQLPQ